MRVQTEEWQRFIPGIRMHKGKKTYFYNGEILWEGDAHNGHPLIYDEEERLSWEVIMVMPGVEVITDFTFMFCVNVKIVIMHEDVKRIEKSAFLKCENLKFVKLSRNLEIIGVCAFWFCESLTSIFIPPSCREIGDGAFRYCRQLLILGMPQNIQIRDRAFANTLLMTKCPFSFEVDKDECFSSEDEATSIQWVKTINNEDAHALHRACSSYNPLLEIVHTLVKQQGIKAMQMKNAVGVTPSQYLEANTFADISEKEIVKRYILDMMGEVL